MLADLLPVGRIKTSRHWQRWQIPNIRPQTEVPIAEHDAVNVHRDIVGSQADRQRSRGRNRHFDDRIEKGIGERARGMNVYLARRLIVDDDADGADVCRGIANR